MAKYQYMSLNDNVEEMFIGPFGSSLKNDSFVDESNAFCMVYEQKHAIKKTMNVETRYVNREKYEELKRFNIHGGDIIVSCRGTIGETYIVPDDAPLGIMHPSIMKIRLKPGVYNKQYFNLLLRNYLKQHEDEANGSGIKMAISAKELGATLFPVPDMTEQDRIASAFNQVEELITLRKEQLAKLDEFVKSRFIELFGDPIRNTQNRPTTDFINVVKMQRGFDLPVQDRQQDGGIPVFGSNGALDRHNVAKVQGGGVITGRSGTIGKVYYTEGDYWPLNTSLFSVDTHGNNIIYLAYLLQMYDLSRFTEGTGVPTLNRNKFHNKPIIDVPLNEQEQFATFVAQTDKSKLAIQQSLTKLELLKKSLMQEYFGQGEREWHASTKQ